MELEVIEPRFVFLESSLPHPPNIEIAHMGVRVVQPTVRFSYFKPQCVCQTDFVKTYLRVCDGYLTCGIN